MAVSYTHVTYPLSYTHVAYPLSYTHVTYPLQSLHLSLSYTHTPHFPSLSPSVSLSLSSHASFLYLSLSLCRSPSNSLSLSRALSLHAHTEGFVGMSYTHFDRVQDVVSYMADASLRPAIDFVEAIGLSLCINVCVGLQVGDKE